MATYELDSFSIPYAEFGTGSSRVEVRANNFVVAGDPKSVIDKIAETLLMAGWSMENPYPTIPLGTGQLISKTVDGDGAVVITFSDPGGTSGFNTGARQYLLISRVSGALYPPTLYRTKTISSASSTKTCIIEPVLGVDRAWPVGSTVKQVRGIAAEGRLFVPAFQDASMATPASFTDHDGNSTHLQSGALLICNSTYPPGGICSFIPSLDFCLQGNWRFGDEPVRPGPSFGYFPAIGVSAGLGRDLSNGTPDGNNDNTGPGGNEPLVGFPAGVSPYYGGGRTPDVNGGGWFLKSYPTATNLSFGVFIVENTNGTVSLFFTGHGHTITTFDQTNGHFCPEGTYDNQFFLPRLFNAPEYRLYTDNINGQGFGALGTPTYSIIANPYQFWVTDVANKVDQISGLGGNSIFAAIPFLDVSRTPSLTTITVVVGGGMLMEHAYWTNWPVSVALNGDYTTFKSDGDFAVLGKPALGYSTFIFDFAQPLRTSIGHPIIRNAYLWASPNSATEAGIVGKIYDALVVTEPLDVGSTFHFSGHDFQVVSNQVSGPQCALAVAISPTSFDNF